MGKMPSPALNSVPEAQAQEEVLGRGIGGRAFAYGRLGRLAARNVVDGRFRVLPAPLAVEGMRVRAEAEVRLAAPVLEIVARLVAGPREVGDLVPRYSPARQTFHRELVEIGNLVFARHVARAVALAEREQFGA